jgi:hypothetical protein
LSWDLNDRRQVVGVCGETKQRPAVRTQAFDVNDRGQIVGFYATPGAAPSRARRPTRPSMMSGS